MTVPLLTTAPESRCSNDCLLFEVLERVMEQHAQGKRACGPAV